ncbi:MAG: hypothetical protein J1E62_08545 [Lachnospiraceae bacterium]|nr:hypothetical protein [Lachnospiraceae bacterium]
MKSGDKVIVSKALKSSAEPKKKDDTGLNISGSLKMTPEPDDNSDDNSDAEPVDNSLVTKGQNNIVLNSDGYPQILSDDKVKMYRDTGTAVIGDTGFEIYNYVPSIAGTYAKAINKAGSLFDKDVKVYDVLIPTGVGVTLPDNKMDKVNSSHQGESIEKLESKIKSPVETISLYDILMTHRTEYIFFRTDHHWTARGAYYGYRKICEVTGRTPHELSEYPKKKFGSFIGTYYGDTNGNKKLRKDSVVAYYPLGEQISMTYRTDSGKTTEGSVIVDSSNFGISGKYLAFMAGDNSYSLITNKEVEDGSVCVVVKESYGNALVPYMADHYSEIYVVDYRYYKGKLSKLVKEKKAKEVFFMNNLSMTRNSYLVGKLNQLIK